MSFTRMQPSWNPGNRSSWRMSLIHADLSFRGNGTLVQRLVKKRNNVDPQDDECCCGFKFYTCALFWLTIMFILVVTLKMSEETFVTKMDPHIILGVARHATASDIRKAYRQKSLLYHPGIVCSFNLNVTRYTRVSLQPQKIKHKPSTIITF